MHTELHHYKNIQNIVEETFYVDIQIILKHTQLLNTWIIKPYEQRE